MSDWSRLSLIGETAVGEGGLPWLLITCSSESLSFVSHQMVTRKRERINARCQQMNWFVFFSRPTAVSDGSAEEEKQRQDEGSLRAPSPLVYGRISSDESDAEAPEEPIEFPFSAVHPKPLAVSSWQLKVFFFFYNNIWSWTFEVHRKSCISCINPIYRDITY